MTDKQPPQDSNKPGSPSEAAEPAQRGSSRPTPPEPATERPSEAPKASSRPKPQEDSSNTAESPTGEEPKEVAEPNATGAALERRQRTPGPQKKSNPKKEEGKDASAPSSASKEVERVAPSKAAGKPDAEEHKPGTDIEPRKPAGAAATRNKNGGSKEVARNKPPKSTAAARRGRQAIQQGGKAVAAAGAAGTAGEISKQGNLEGGNEQKPSAGRRTAGAVGNAALMLGKAGGAKIAVAAKAILSSVVALGVVTLVALLVILFIILAGTAERTISHTSKYGCVESKFSIDFLEGMGVKDGTSIWDTLSDFGEEAECGTTNGSGFTGDFYPPGLGSITSGWMRGGGDPSHKALDISNGQEGYPNAPIFAYAGGEVTFRQDGTANSAYCGNPMSFGDYSVQGLYTITHEPGQLETLYAHMWKKDQLVKVGDIVSAGQDIAGQGNSGWSCGTHLHFEVIVNGVQINPLDHFKENGIEYPYPTMDSLPEKPDPSDSPDVDPNSPLKTPPSTPYLKTARAAMKSNGINPSKKEEMCLIQLWNRESNWRVDAINPAFAPGQAAIPENQAYGIPQSGPGIKMADQGSDWKTNPHTQIKWGMGYIKGRYGTPCGAWAHSEANNWY